MSSEGKHLLRDEDGPIFDTSLGVLFQRGPHGCVKIAMGGTTNEIGPGVWAAVVASMSERGETPETLDVALSFHRRRE